LVPGGSFTAATPHAGVAATSLALVPASQGVKATSIPQEEIALASIIERVVTASGAHVVPSSSPVPAAPILAND
jgi:exosome complex RNA-binding protein Rrp42 (RNase PH superfamily)